MFFMSIFVFVLVAIAYDYFKSPVDVLYFQRSLRPVVAIRNFLYDLFLSRHYYRVRDFPGLWMVMAHFNDICEEYYLGEAHVKKTFFHDDDPWFEWNPDYYFIKVQEFPKLHALLKTIPCVEDDGIIAVMESPMQLPPHRAETNIQLRYQLVLQGTTKSVLHTQTGDYSQNTREEILFDHALEHSVSNTGSGRRVVLLLNIKRL